MKKRMKSGFFWVLFVIYSMHAFGQSDLVITEILYNQPGNDTLEFIELYNKGSQPINLNGYKITSGFGYTFPNYTLNSGSYVVVAKYATFFNETFGLTPLQWDSGGLSNSGEKIVIKNPSGDIVDSVEYKNKLPWDKKADGKGSSLVLCDVNSDNALGYFWAASNDIGGIFEDGSIIYASPGSGNSVCTATGDIYSPNVKKAFAPANNIIKVIFNEAVTTGTAQSLANYTGLNISSAVLSASKDTVILTLAVPLSLSVFNTITVSNVSDIAGNIMTTQSVSLAFNDSQAPLVITEIMYNNPGNDTLEFIEIFNNGFEAANVGGYYFSDGIDYVFPSVIIAPHEYFVVCANKEFFDAFFGVSNTYQWESGSLSNTGEKLKIKNTAGVVIDEVSYSNVAPWPKEPDGGGPSLIFCDPSEDNSDPSFWSFSESPAKDFQGMSVSASPFGANGLCVLSLFGSDSKPNLVKVYPNPSKGIFNIENSGNIQARVDIINYLGQSVYTSDTRNSGMEVDLSKYGNGIYYMRLTDLQNGSVTITKILVE